MSAQNSCVEILTVFGDGAFGACSLAHECVASMVRISVL